MNKTVSPFDELFEFNKITLALKKVIERNSWDQEAIMPTGAIEDRAEEQASLMIIAHKRQTSGEFSDLVDSIEPEKLSKIELRQFKLMKKDLTRALKVPTELVGALAKETTLAHSVWVNARKNNNFQQFLPHFSKVLELRKEEADAIRQGSSLSRYDALLQDYEPDVKSDYIDKIFNSLRPALVDLRSLVLDQPPAQEITGFFPLNKQRQLCNEIAHTFTYDFSRGRIDTAVHPFCSGSGNDVRITTRFDENDPLGSIYSTIHEVGHALYEQNIEKKYKVGEIYEGVVTKIMDYGCFVKIEDGIEGLVHSSELDWTNRNAKPNSVHFFLSDKKLITQNIDSLDEKAGNKDYISIHGNLNKVTFYYDEDKKGRRFEPESNQLQRIESADQTSV